MARLQKGFEYMINGIIWMRISIMYFIVWPNWLAAAAAAAGLFILVDWEDNLNEVLWSSVY